MNGIDHIGDAIDRLFVQEITAYASAEMHEHRALPEFRSAFILRLCEELGAVVADGLALQYAPDPEWKTSARAGLALVADEWAETMDGLRLSLEAHAIERADLRPMLVCGFETRLAAIIVQEMSR